MKLLFSYMKKYPFGLFVVLTVKIIGTLMDLILPWILAYIIDDLVPIKDLKMITIFGAIMMVASILAWVMNVYANRKAAYIAKLCTTEMRHDLFKKTLSLSAKQTDDLSIPSLISRMTTDTYNTHSFIGMLQRMGIRAPILLVGGIVMTVFLEPTLTLVMLCCLPLIIIVIFVVTKYGVPLYKIVQTKVDKLVLTVRENVSGAKVIKALGKEEFEKDRFKAVNEDVSKMEIKATRTMNIINPCLNLIMNVGLIFVIYFGAKLVYKGDIGNGKIIAFITYFTIILNALLSVTRIFINGSKASASASRIKEVLIMEDDLVLSNDGSSSDAFIEFRDVNFSYNKIKNNVEGISFSLKNGESLGIIGSTGSGKSTLVSLLLRFYDPDNGQIFVDGKNIKNMSKVELHSYFGVVFQNDIIFGNTILENIDFGRSINFMEIKDATKIAQASFIEDKGYSLSLASKGGNLSGGERQRVLLSRAIANKPKILILDDSSSALDYKTDQNLRSAIKENLSETSLIIIASRISAIKNCSKIVVLEEGRILDIGTHEELLNRCDLYKSIKISQMGGEANEL